MAGVPSSGCGGHRSRAFLIHTCDVERATISVDTATIRDRKITWSAVESDVACWFEDLGKSIADHNSQLGRIPVGRFSVWFNGGIGVLAGDRLKKGSTYYLVETVRDYSAEGFHVVCEVREQGYAAQ